MQNNPIIIFLAIVTGVGLGLVSTVLLQQHMNRQAIQECRENTERKLVTLSTVIGDTHYCIPGGYFAH